MKTIRLLLLLCLFVPGALLAQAQQVQPPTVLKSETGRFVFGQVGPARADQFLLDTKTGRMWQIVVDSENRQKLQPVRFIHAQGNEAYLPESEDAIQSIDQMLRRLFLEELQKKAP